MAVRVRLTRVGSKKNAMWRVVVADQRSPRDGRFIEMIGHYNPHTQPSQIVIDRERLDHWISRGAEPSGTVRKLMRAPNSQPLGAVAADALPDEAAGSAPDPEAVTPPSEGAGTPPSEGAGTPPSEGAGTPPSEGTSTPPSEGTSTPPSEGTGTPPSEGAGTPPSEGAGTPPSEGAGTPPSEGTLGKPASDSDPAGEAGAGGDEAGAPEPGSESG